MQMLYQGSEETPAVPGLGVLPGVARLLPDGVKRPQMQWNLLERRGESGLLADVPDPTWVYFVHSYAVDSDDHVVATCNYGGPVVAAVEAGALWATQFHPEKSGATGMRILANFVSRAVESAAAA
jgi:glutamine amidotransferase